jgi:hypothetical protein
MTENESWTTGMSDVRTSNVQTIKIHVDDDGTTASAHFKHCEHRKAGSKVVDALMGPSGADHNLVTEYLRRLPQRDPALSARMVPCQRCTGGPCSCPVCAPVQPATQDGGAAA